MLLQDEQMQQMKLLFHSKWSKLPFWVKIVVTLSVAQLVTTVIFFSVLDKSHVKLYKTAEIQQGNVICIISIKMYRCALKWEKIYKRCTELFLPVTGDPRETMCSTQKKEKHSRYLGLCSQHDESQIQGLRSKKMWISTSIHSLAP